MNIISPEKSNNFKDNKNKIKDKRPKNIKFKDTVQTLKKINRDDFKIIEIKSDGNCFYRILLFFIRQ